MEKKIRVLITKLGLDHHYFGAQAVAHGLRDAGMEVILLGGDITPDDAAQIALQEDVDVVGASILAGNYLYLLTECVKQLKARGVSDVLIIAGGIIDDRDVGFLKEQGIVEIWRPGAAISDIVHYIQNYFQVEGVSIQSHRDVKVEPGPTNFAHD